MSSHLYLITLWHELIGKILAAPSIEADERALFGKKVAKKSAWSQLGIFGAVLISLNGVFIE